MNEIEPSKSETTMRATEAGAERAMKFLRWACEEWDIHDHFDVRIRDLFEFSLRAIPDYCIDCHRETLFLDFGYGLATFERAVVLEDMVVVICDNCEPLFIRRRTLDEK
ncbi:MAG: hypothetical protein WAN77_02465, partial [Thermoplasmata archaeon]